MIRTRLLTASCVLTMVVVGCSSGAAPTGEYDAVRSEFVSVVAQGLDIDDASSMTFEISNAEIDCVAEGTGMSVTELAQELARDTTSTTTSIPTPVVDADTVIFRCFSSDTVRDLFGDALDSTGANEAELAAAGVDRGCLLDLVVGAFEQWRASAEPFIALENAFETILQNEAATCAAG